MPCSLYRLRVGSARTSILVIVAAVMSAGALGTVVWRLTCSTCGSGAVQYFEPVEIFSSDENAKADRLWNDVLRRSVRSGSVSSEDMEIVRLHTLPTESYWTRQMAFGIMAEFLDRELDMSEETRRVIIQTHLEMLSDADGHMRLASVAQCDGLGLLEKQQVREAVLALQYDTNDIIAQRVKRIDWSEYDEAG